MNKEVVIVKDSEKEVYFAVSFKYKAVKQITLNDIPEDRSKIAFAPNKPLGIMLYRNDEQGFVGILQVANEKPQLSWITITDFENDDNKDKVYVDNEIVECINKVQLSNNWLGYISKVCSTGIQFKSLSRPLFYKRLHSQGLNTKENNECVHIENKEYEHKENNAYAVEENKKAVRDKENEHKDNAETAFEVKGNEQNSVSEAKENENNAVRDSEEEHKENFEYAVEENKKAVKGNEEKHKEIEKEATAESDKATAESDKATAESDKGHKETEYNATANNKYAMESIGKEQLQQVFKTYMQEIMLKEFEIKQKEQELVAIENKTKARANVIESIIEKLDEQEFTKANNIVLDVDTVYSCMKQQENKQIDIAQELLIKSLCVGDRVHIDRDFIDNISVYYKKGLKTSSDMTSYKAIVVIKLESKSDNNMVAILDYKGKEEKAVIEVLAAFGKNRIDERSIEQYYISYLRQMKNNNERG